jgi:thiamine biosynthesis lipoprotein
MSRRGTLRSGVQSKVIATAGFDGAAFMTAGLYRGLVALAAVIAGGCQGVAPDVASATAAAAVRVVETRPLMGVAWSITVFAADRDAARRAIDAGFAEAARIERVLSDYDPASELSRLSAAAPTPQPVPVGDDLWNVLVRADEIQRLSDGAFDLTVGPLTTLWRQSRRSGHLPRPDRLTAARNTVGWHLVALDPERRAVSLSRPGMRLDPGGIGMGYAVDRVLAVLTERGIAAAMVDASGDVGVSGPPPGAAGWRVRVDAVPGADAGQTLVLAHAAVTTSGDARQFVEIDGRRYSHVVDPRSGIGVSGPAAVTVIAADCTTADALATAASVLGPEAGPALVAAIPGAAARFFWLDGQAPQTVVTPGWPRP